MYCLSIITVCLFVVCIRLSVPYVFVHEIDEEPHGSSQRIKLYHHCPGTSSKTK